jgi:hypothetical protein
MSLYPQAPLQVVLQQRDVDARVYANAIAAAAKYAVAPPHAPCRRRARHAAAMLPCAPCHRSTTAGAKYAATSVSILALALHYSLSS